MSGFKLWWITGTFAILMLLIPGNLAWGKEGHYAICKIAEVKPFSFSSTGKFVFATFNYYFDDYVSYLFNDCVLLLVFESNHDSLKTMVEGLND